MTKETITIDNEIFTENILVVDNFIPKSYCNRFIDTFINHDDLKIKTHLKGINQTDVEEVIYEKVCVCEVPDENFVNFIASLMHGVYSLYLDVLVDRSGDENVILGLPDLNSYNIELPIIKKYEPDGNSHFGPHCDTYMSGWDGNLLKVNRNYRFLNILFYLNDVEEGGETEFYFKDKNIRVKPKAGRVVVFPPFWTHIHAGLRPISGQKYIMNGYLNHKITDKEYLEMVMKTGNDQNITSFSNQKAIFPYSVSKEEHF